VRAKFYDSLCDSYALLPVLFCVALVFFHVASNREQVTHLSCAQANSASYPKMSSSSPIVRYRVIEGLV